MDMSAKKARNPIKQMMRREINLEPGCEIEICRAVEDAILDNGLPVYVKAGMLVEAIEADTLVADEGEYAIGRTVRLIPIDVQRMKGIMSETCLFLKWDKKTKDWIPAATPIDIAYLMLAGIGHWPFQEVTNIVAAQTLNNQGNIVDEPGVHKQSRLLLAGLPKLPAVIIADDKSAAIDAVDMLNGLLSEFEFVDEASRSVALSMLITPVCRGIIPMAPMHAVTAPTPGSGKSYLSRLASLIATGRPCPVIPPARDEIELEKRLTAAMLAGPSIISLDNINSRLGSSLLCQALTEPVIDVRPLGSSSLARIEQRVTWFANGNHLTLVDDLTRRCILATLDRNEENPEEHDYHQRPDKVILADRGRYVHAGLTVVGSYLKSKGKVRLPPLASYEAWSKSVREALVWLGYEDPVLSMKNVKENDPERNKREAVFANWPEKASGNDWEGNPKLLTVAELIEEPGGTLDEAEAWREALKQVADDGKGGVDKHTFGNWLRRQKDRVVAGRKLVSQLDGKRKIMKWGCVPAITSKEKQ